MGSSKLLLVVKNSLITPRKLTYPTLGKEHHRLKHAFKGEMLVPWRVAPNRSFPIQHHYPQGPMRSKSENVTPLKRNECPPKKGTISKNNFILQPLITKGTCDVLVFRGVTAGSPTKTSPQCVSKQTNRLNHPNLTSKLFFGIPALELQNPGPYKTLWFWGFRCFFQKNGLLLENFLSYLIPGYTSRIPHHPPHGEHTKWPSWEMP